MDPLKGMLLAVGILFALAVLSLLFMAMLVPMFKIIGTILRRTTAFIVGIIVDSLRFTGAVVTAVVLMLLATFAVLVGRWSAASHYGKAIQGEFKAAGTSLYRVCLGHLLTAFSLSPLTEGLEKRLPQVVKAAPGKDKPTRRIGQFEGYTIVGSLAGGGSGGKLYVAEPDAIRAAAFERQGFGQVSQVVIKAFSLKDGSSLPQIVRESRSLDAAKKLGLVLDHELTDERFYYVMRFVPGESLSLLTQRLHAESGQSGLDDARLRRALGYVAELLTTLDTYHRGGLWHKDVKPDNIIVDRDRAHLVDFGLVTPLRSAMTLTTHGTEYFRDPEMVRMALKGVKVHEVDGAKFDIYAAGAVLYSVIENSFPAHGGLSQITKRCPEAVRWIVRRAMTDYDKRYASSGAMLADLKQIVAATDPFAVKPVALPSVGGGPLPEEPRVPDEFDLHVARATARVPVGPPSSGATEGAQFRSKPKLRVTDWWKGTYDVVSEQQVEVRPPSGSKAWKLGPLEIIVGAGKGVQIHTRSGAAAEATSVAAGGKPNARAGNPRRPAAEQIASARARVHEMRERARARRHPMSPAEKPAGTGGRIGLALALLAVISTVGGVAIYRLSQNARVTVTSDLPKPLVAGAQVLPPPGEPEPVAPTPPVPTRPEGGAPGTLTAQLALMTAASAAEYLVTNSQDKIVLFIPGEQIGSFTSADRALIGSIEGQLGAQGFEVVGSPLFRSTAHADQLTQWQSDVRYLCGVRPLSSEGIEEDIGRWLAQTPKVGYVLWLVREDGQIKPYLFTTRHPADDFLVLAQQNMLDGIVRAAVDFAVQNATP